MIQDICSSEVVVVVSPPVPAPTPNTVPQCLYYGRAKAIGPTCLQALFALISRIWRVRGIERGLF